MRTLHRWIIAAVTMIVSGTAWAETLCAPTGGRAISIGADRVGCKESLGSGSGTLEGEGHPIRAPARDDAAGQTTVIRAAATEAGCSGSSHTITLNAMAARPAVDPLGGAEMRRIERHTNGEVGDESQ